MIQGSESFRLVVRRGPQPNQAYDLTKDVVTLGRDITNDITINDPEVSRHHMRLMRGAGGYTIEDLGSTNGTFINGQRVPAARVLRPGDMVGLGETVTLAYEMISAAPLPGVGAPQMPMAGTPSDYGMAGGYGQQPSAPGMAPGYAPPPQSPVPSISPQPPSYQPQPPAPGFQPQQPSGPTYSPSPVSPAAPSAPSGAPGYGQSGYGQPAAPGSYGQGTPGYGQGAGQQGGYPSGYAPGSAAPMPPQAPPAGYGGDYDPYAVREEESNNTLRWVLIGCGAATLFCCCTSVIGLVAVDSLCLWESLGPVYTFLRTLGFSSTC